LEINSNDISQLGFIRTLKLSSSQYNNIEIGDLTRGLNNWTNDIESQTLNPYHK
jgi:hypothetical protein